MGMLHPITSSQISTLDLVLCSSFLVLTPENEWSIPYKDLFALLYFPLGRDFAA